MEQLNRIVFVTNKYINQGFPIAAHELNNPSAPRTDLLDWLRLVRLFQLCGKLPRGEKTLSDIFLLARDAYGDPPTPTTADSLLKSLSEGTGWNFTDLQYLIGVHTDRGFGFVNLDDLKHAFKDEVVLARLYTCFSMMNRLGVSAEQCSSWSMPDLDFKAARSAKQASKARYDGSSLEHKEVRNLISRLENFLILIEKNY